MVGLWKRQCERFCFGVLGPVIVEPLASHCKTNYAAIKTYWTSHVARTWDAVMGKPETAAILGIAWSFVKLIRCFLLVNHITRSHGSHHLLVCHATMPFWYHYFHQLTDLKIINQKGNDGWKNTADHYCWWDFKMWMPLFLSIEIGPETCSPQS